MRPKFRPFPCLAFTRTELIASIGALALLITLVLPALGNSRRVTDLAACVNNLRQIGRAYQIWGHDHNDDRPYRVPQAEGGIMSHPLLGNTWFNFAFISNELAAPRILACPSDTAKRVARDFGNSSDGGLLSSGYRNNAVSYFVGTDAIRLLPQSFLCGDRNVRVDGYGSCNAGINNAAYIRVRPLVGPFWTNNVHGLWGNILFYDGQVRTVSNQSVTDIAEYADENGIPHLVMP